MKLGLIFTSAFFGLVLGTSVAIAQADTGTPAHESHAKNASVRTVENPIDIAVSTSVRFVGAPKARKHAPRTWTCGAQYETALGTLVRDCAWK